MKFLKYGTSPRSDLGVFFKYFLQMKYFYCIINIIIINVINCNVLINRGVNIFFIVLYSIPQVRFSLSSRD